MTSSMSLPSVVLRRLAVSDDSAAPVIVTAAGAHAVFPSFQVLQHVAGHVRCNDEALPLQVIDLVSHRNASPNTLSIAEHWRKWLQHPSNSIEAFLKPAMSLIETHVTAPCTVLLPASAVLSTAIASTALLMRFVSALRQIDAVRAIGLHLPLATPLQKAILDFKSNATVFISMASSTESFDVIQDGKKYVSTAEAELTTRNKSGKTHQQRVCLGVTSSGHVDAFPPTRDELCDYTLFVKRPEAGVTMKVTKMKLGEGQEESKGNEESAVAGHPATAIGYEEQSGQSVEGKARGEASQGGNGEGQMSVADLKQAAAAASKAASQQKSSGATSEVSTGVPAGVLVYVEPEDSDDSSDSSDDDDLDL